jgi:diguanylate cyclase (GGDEF)-like protein
VEQPPPPGSSLGAGESGWVLVCDHRGEGAAERARWLALEGTPVEVAPTLRSTLERLSLGRPQVIVIDPLAGSGEAEVEALDAARQGDPRPALLVIVEDGAPIAPTLERIQPHERGPWEVIRRSAPRDEFLLRVALLRRQTESLRDMERLRHLATHDDRTDLLRPQVFQDLLRQHFSACQRHHLDLGLLLVDLDDFGRINKLHDHTVGDAVISRVGVAIKSSLRAEDVAARVGGDEFCVLLPYTRKVDAAHVVQRLLENIREGSAGVAASGPPIRVTASIGFETFNGSDLESVERLRLHAEEALRVAKLSGGDRGVYYRSLDSARRGEVDPLTQEQHP